MPEPDPLPIAVRAYAPPHEKRRRRKRASSQAQERKPRVPRSPEPQRRPEAILVLDTETTLDAAQSLIVGAYRFCLASWQDDGPTLTCVEEGIVVPDELGAEGLSALRRVERYVESTVPASGGASDARRTLQLRTRAQFVRDVLVAALDGRATVVGFNLPFDLSRLALDWGVAEMEGFEGGFSFLLGEYTDDAGARRADSAVPRMVVRSFDSRRARMRVGAVRPGADPYALVRGSGSFLDLRQFAHALTGEAHTIESACREFDVPYRKRDVALGTLSSALIDYCREDVAATAALWESLAREYERWHLQRSPTRIYSGASLAKAIVREARISPFLKRQPTFSEETLGYAMSAYYGGRSEVRIRCQPMPVTTLDFRSMHPTVAVLTGLSAFLTCAEVEVVREGRSGLATLQSWLDGLTVDDCLAPSLWSQLNVFVEVEPDGDVIPVRAQYSRWSGYGIGVNPLWSEERLWYPLADLVAAKLVTGKAPCLRRARRLLPRGRLEAMRSLRIRDARAIDPAEEDVFRALVEERRRCERRGDGEGARTAAALKVVANCLAYGIWAELNRQEPTAKPARLAVNGLDRFYADVHAVEERGEYFFCPLASLVAGGARLMLATLEALITDSGGTWLSCDTDGMAVVATRRGGLVPCLRGTERDEAGRECVRALSWEQVDGLVERFSSLNPYDRTLVPGSLLSLEPENFAARERRRRRQLHCYAISAKRYCLYTLARDGIPRIVKASKHALGGVYLDPRDPDSDRQDWVDEAWAWIVAQDGLGIDAPDPDWLDLHALSRFTASHPRLVRAFETMNAGLPYAGQVKPYGFLLVAHAAPGGLPPGADPERFVLVAPFEPDPERWADLPWRNIHDPTGQTYRLDARSVFERRGYSLSPNTVAARTYRDALRSFRSRPESKSHGQRGLLRRRPVRAIPPVAHIGKEANVLDQVAAGLVAREGEALTVYTAPSEVGWNADCVRVLREMNVRATAAALGVNPSTITRIRSGAQQPQRKHERALFRLVAEFARAGLRAGGIAVALDDDAAIRAYARIVLPGYERRLV